jgi:hypothetical protein
MDPRLNARLARDAVALPLHIGSRATSLGLRIAGQAAGVGIRALGRLMIRADPDPTSGDVEHEEPTGRARVDATVETPRTPPAREAAALAEPADPAEGLDPVPAAPPAHVSEQPELVDSYAEAGAEDGPGASVHVAEPWKGYGHMTADDVAARLTAASLEEVAAVELYERSHKGRRTVLTAAGRRLQRASAPR